MTRIRCPQDRCIFNLDGWCDSDEIELDASTLTCITFEEVDYETYRVHQDDDDELEWDDEEPLWDEDLDESLYEVDDDEEEEEDEELALEEDDDWT